MCSAVPQRNRAACTVFCTTPLLTCHHRVTELAHSQRCVARSPWRRSCGKLSARCVELCPRPPSCRDAESLLAPATESPMDKKNLFAPVRPKKIPFQVRRAQGSQLPQPCATLTHRAAAAQGGGGGKEKGTLCRAALAKPRRADLAALHSAWMKRQHRCTKSSSRRSMAAAHSLAPRRLCVAA